MFYVYEIRNLINGKIYVGKSSNVNNRWKTHLRTAKGGKAKYPKHFQYLHAAINFHGIDQFQITIVDEYDCESKSLDREVELISQYKDRNVSLYNLTNGGEGASGNIVSIEGRKRMSDASARKGMKGTFLGKHHSDESKKKMSKAHTGKFVCSATREKQSKNNSGSKNRGAKIDETDVLNIRNKYANGVSYEELSAEYLLHIVVIRRIIRGKNWKNVGGPIKKISKIAWDKIVELRSFAEANPGFTYKQLGELFSMPESTIESIVNYRRRKNK